VICSLVSDLYCPGDNPRETLARDSNLAQAARRYKIDTAKLTSEAREDLIEKRKKNQKGGSAATTVKPTKQK
jgi:hypothetical protein